MNVRVAAAETLLLAGLLLLAAFVVWDSGPALGLPENRWLTWLTGFFPGLLSPQLLALLALLMAAYWTLQVLGHGQLSFWLVAGLVILPHAVPVWGHNQLAWYELLGVQAELVGERSLLYDAALLLAGLAGVVALHRVIGLRALDRRMAMQGVGSVDRGRVLKFEALLLAGLLAAGLSLAVGVVLVAALLGRYDEILAGSTWAVAAVGAGAALLLALTLLLWRRSP